MTKHQPANIAASIRQKLMNLAAKTGDDPNLIWSRYAVERLLYRLSVSEFSGKFVLKGAALFMVWSKEPHRPTMDLDLLGHGEDSSERMEDIFLRICRMLSLLREFLLPVMTAAADKAPIPEHWKVGGPWIV